MVVFNQQAEYLFDYSREQVIGQQVEILLPERLRDVHIRHRASYMRQPRVRQMGTTQILLGLRRDGQEFPIEIMLSPMMTAKRGCYVMAVVRRVLEVEAVT